MPGRWMANSLFVAGGVITERAWTDISLKSLPQAVPPAWERSITRNLLKVKNIRWISFEATGRSPTCGPNSREKFL